MGIDNEKISLILSLLFLSVILTACGNNEKNSDDVERSSNTNKQDEDNDQREERQSTEQSEAKRISRYLKIQRLKMTTIQIQKLKEKR